MVGPRKHFTNLKPAMSVSGDTDVAGLVSTVTGILYSSLRRVWAERMGGQVGRRQPVRLHSKARHLTRFDD